MKLNHKIITAILFISFLYCQFNSQTKTAKMYEINQKWDSAISIYKDIINKSPNNYQAKRNLKNVYIKSQKYEDGIKYFESHLNNNYNNMQVIIDIGEFYFLAEKRDKAIEIWEDGINKFSENKSFYRILLSTYDKYNLNDELFFMIKNGRENFGNNFLANEMGIYFQRRKLYDKAIDEFIKTLLFNPGRGSSVSRRILMMSDDKEGKDIIEMKLLEASIKFPKVLLPTLADHYFKHQDYINSFHTYTEWANEGYFNAQKWLGYANNLREERAFNISIDAYRFALKQDLNKFQLGEALLGLAKTFEKQIHPIEENHLIPYFYNDNIFFDDVFKIYSTISSENLQSSLNIYDSILVSIPKSSLVTEAQFRLAEIHYLIIEDFDKALSLYNQSLLNNPSNQLKKKIILRIGDVLFSKGENRKSIAFLDSMYKTSQFFELKNKLIETHLFSGNIDTVLSLIDEVFSEITPSNPSFNDLMEVRDIIDNFYTKEDEKGKIIFDGFLKSERLIRQKKLSESNESLKSIILNNNKSEFLSNLIIRRAMLLIKQKNFDEALEILHSIINTSLGDKSIIMSGQIYEQAYNNPDKALEYYMTIINDYPDSIFFEPIRNHLRKIKNTIKS